MGGNIENCCCYSYGRWWRNGKVIISLASHGTLKIILKIFCFMVGSSGWVGITLVNLCVPWKECNFLLTWRTVSFLRSSEVCGVEKSIEIAWFCLSELPGNRWIYDYFTFVCCLMLFWCECNGKISFLDFQAYIWKRIENWGKSIMSHAPRKLV